MRFLATLVLGAFLVTSAFSAARAESPKAPAKPATKTCAPSACKTSKSCCPGTAKASAPASKCCNKSGTTSKSPQKAAPKDGAKK